MSRSDQAERDPQEAERPLRVGISSCLLGQRVRYDAGHKRDAFLTERLGPFVEWVPVCPEVELGMGIPRPSIRLELRDAELRLIEPRSGEDHTEAMRRLAERRIRELRTLCLDGYVLKKGSPSCGMERVRVYTGQGRPASNGRGLFAGALRDALPDLPVEEEGRLHDPNLRENFIERLFAHARLRAMFRPRWRMHDLIEFHASHKLQLMAHSPQAYRSLGRLVAGAKALPRRELERRYRSAFMHALAQRATPGRTTNVLQHIAGYLREHLETALRHELCESIEDYRRGHVPLVVPVTLLRHYAIRFEIDYLRAQHFLAPHPRELMLRNHV